LDAKVYAGANPQKSSQFGLFSAKENMKMESLVIAEHYAAVNFHKNLVHTARQAMGVDLV